MKYSPEQLKDMAQRALAARAAGDPRWLQLVFTLAMKGRWMPPEIERGVEMLASGEVPK